MQKAVFWLPKDGLLQRIEYQHVTQAETMRYGKGRETAHKNIAANLQGTRLMTTFAPVNGGLRG